MTWVQLSYDDQAIYLRFRVEDRFVIATHTQPQSDVCKDSCVEFFVQPDGFDGYFNFEFNCIGTMLAHYTVQSHHTPLPPEVLKSVVVGPSLSGPIAIEIPDPVNWTLEATIPFDVFKFASDFKTPSPGTIWRANFYKCAGHCSHPHWLSWKPIGAILNFHLPSHFGEVQFV